MEHTYCYEHVPLLVRSYEIDLRSGILKVAMKKTLLNVELEELAIGGRSDNSGLTNVAMKYCAR